jgi:hypothetical protein
MSREEVADGCNRLLADRHQREQRAGQFVGMTANTIGGYERGLHRYPNKDYRWALCTFFNMTAVELGLYNDRATPRSPQPDTLTAGENLADVPRTPAIADTGSMNRRDLLRIVTNASAVMASHQIIDSVDWDRVDSFAEYPQAPIDEGTLREYRVLNGLLWSTFAAATSKAIMQPVVTQQLGMLTGSLGRSQTDRSRKTLCELLADLAQLAGEIAFDANRYLDAAHCYTLAGTAAREADAPDLWACALTRHAFIGVYERQFRDSIPLLSLAAKLATRGDQQLSTRHWVGNVQGQAFAGLGDEANCQRSLDLADEVELLGAGAHNGGWLRFDGSRLAEERGTCNLELGKVDLAEAVLTKALHSGLSDRRRGSVLVDLASLGAKTRDFEVLILQGSAAVEIAAQTRSGFIGRRLRYLRTQLRPILNDRRVQSLDGQISSVLAQIAHNE